MDKRCGLWFGTEDRMRWFQTPRAGADMSPEGWSTGETLLSGGGFERHSWGTHKRYVFEWRDSSSRETAQLMKSYRDGAYGKGLIYFVDPLIYDQNIFPARWANPGMTLDFEGPSLVYGLDGEGVPTSGGETNDLPITSAYYNLADLPGGWRGTRDSVFLPIPEGYTLYLGAFYQATGSGAVYVTPVNSNGTLGGFTSLTPVANDATNIVPDSFSGGRGVRVWLGRSPSLTGSVTVSAMVARLYPSGATPPASFTGGPWVGGMGHSGCRFQGAPTYVANTGVNGGQVGFAASFKEVGDWQ